MHCRSISFFTFIFVAFGSTVYSDPVSTRESDTEAAVHRLRNESPESAAVELKLDENGTTALDLQPPAETSSPAIEDSRTTLDPTTQPQPRSYRSGHNGTLWFLPSPEPPTLPCRPQPTATINITLLRSLSAEEKSRRLMEAAKKGAVEDARVLLAVGAGVGARGRIGMSTLHWAANRGCVEVVRSLVQAGSELDARDEQDNTPLHLAALHHHTSVVLLLVASAANAKAKNNWGTTPLHWAAYNGDAEATVALLEAGAEKGARNGGGDTPLDYARYYNHCHLIDILT